MDRKQILSWSKLNYFKDLIKIFSKVSSITQRMQMFKKITLGGKQDVSLTSKDFWNSFKENWHRWETILGKLDKENLLLNMAVHCGGVPFYVLETIVQKKKGTKKQKLSNCYCCSVQKSWMRQLNPLIVVNCVFSWQELGKWDICLIRTMRTSWKISRG